MKYKLLKSNIVPLEYNNCYKGVAYNGEDWAVEVKESEEGIIIDVFVRHGELEDSFVFENWSNKNN